jgi:hypothetical protein
MRWCQFIKQREENIHGDSRSGCPAIGFVGTEILSPVETAIYSAHSFAEVVAVSYSRNIRHLRDPLGMKISIYAGCHMNRLRVCLVADLAFAGL